MSLLQHSSPGDFRPWDLIKRRNSLTGIYLNLNELNTVKSAYKKPSCGNHSVLFLMQRCYFQEQPEKFLKLVHKKLFIKHFLFLFFSYSVTLYSISTVNRHNRQPSQHFLCVLSASVPSCN